jgi:hypothetical protein
VLEELSAVKEERVLVLERGAHFEALMNAPGSRFHGSLCTSNSSDNLPFEESLGEGFTGDTGVHRFGAKRDGSGQEGSEKNHAQHIHIMGIRSSSADATCDSEITLSNLQWLLLLLCAPCES